MADRFALLTTLHHFFSNLKGIKLCQNEAKSEKETYFFHVSTCVFNILVCFSLFDEVYNNHNTQGFLALLTAPEFNCRTCNEDMTNEQNTQIVLPMPCLVNKTLLQRIF